MERTIGPARSPTFSTWPPLSGLPGLTRATLWKLWDTYFHICHCKTSSRNASLHLIEAFRLWRCQVGWWATCDLWTGTDPLVSSTAFTANLYLSLFGGSNAPRWPGKWQLPTRLSPHRYPLHSPALKNTQRRKVFAFNLVPLGWHDKNGSQVVTKVR